MGIKSKDRARICGGEADIEGELELERWLGGDLI
jgi:hypothetical protein